MSNDTRNDARDSRFERIKTEVVSGGTQVEVDPPATPGSRAAGAALWIGGLTALGLASLWMLAVVVGIILSVVLHEFGHYWTARRSGMKVTQFFVGFGPRVWSTRRNGVEYGLRVIPLGGFVKIVGMTNVDTVAEADEPMTYRQGTYARRMWVITAGSAMHMIIALVLVVGLYSTAGRYTEAGSVRIYQVLDGTPAAAAGLRANDVVTAVGGTAVTTGDQFRATLGAIVPGTAVPVSIVRDGTQMTLTATLIQSPGSAKIKGYLGVGSDSRARVSMSVTKAVVRGPQDLVTAVGQSIVGFTRVLNPINVWGHLNGSNTDITSRPGTVVGITKISSAVGKNDGWAGIIELLALINISVGVINLFPLLPLDGGHAAIATYERVRSRRGKRYYADVNKLMPVAAVCIALLAFMFLTGLYLDTVKG